VKAQVVIIPVDLKGQDRTYENLFEEIVRHLKTIKTGQNLSDSEKAINDMVKSKTLPLIGM